MARKKYTLSENEENKSLIEMNTRRKTFNKMSAKRGCVLMSLIGCVILTLIVLLPVSLYLYGSRFFVPIRSIDTKIVEGDYILLSNSSHDSILYTSEIEFSLAKNETMDNLDIYRIACDELPLQFESIDTGNVEMNFTNCSTQICFFCPFVYEASSKNSSIGYRVKVDDFAPERTSADILSFANFNLKPIKSIEITTESSSFSLEIRSSSYYSFGIEFKNNSSRPFTFNRFGERAYYNASNNSIWCTVSRNSNTSCISEVGDYCFLAQIEQQSVASQQVHLIHQNHNAKPTILGYSIIVLIAAVILSVTACFLRQRWAKKRRSAAPTDIPQDYVTIVNPSNRLSLHFSVTYENEDSDASGFCVTNDIHDEDCERSLKPASSEVVAHPDQHDNMKLVAPIATIVQNPVDTSHIAPNNLVEDIIEFEKVDFDEGGLVYHSSVHGATIVILEGAVKGQANLQIGASLLFPDFKCEGSFNPVSPFIWIHTDSELLEPAKLYIPHYIDTETSSNTKIFLLAKGHEENALFKVIEDADVELFETVGCVDRRHFCVLCLAAAENDNPPTVRYHVVVVEKEDVTRSGKEVHLCLLYTLTCLKKLRTYYTEQGYNIVAVENLKGGISDGGVTFCTDLSDSEDWQVTQIGKKQRSIKTSDIDIFEVLGCTSGTVTAETKEDLEIYEQAGTYPPRFKLRFFSESNKYRSVTITLQGLTEGECSFSTMLGESRQISLESQDSITATSVSSGPANLSLVSTISNQPSEGDGLIFDLLPYLEGALVDLTICFRFGNYLGIPIPKLHEIESSVGHNFKRCLIKMLFYWKMELHGSSYKVVSETLQKIEYPVLSAIITRRFRSETQNAGDDFVFIAGPIIVEDFEVAPITNIDSLGIEIIQKQLSSLPNGSQVLCSEPTIPDLHNLVVANLPSKWMDFGIQVNIGRPILDAIEKEKRGKCSDCFSQTISTWKDKQSAPFTWETVLRVLYSPAMKEYRAGELVYSHLLHLHGKLMSDGQAS